jgi:hypothetical protein
MRTTKPLLAAFAVSAVVLAAGDARAQTATTTTTTVAPASPWTFTKSPGPVASYALAGPASGVDAMAFTLTATGVAPTTVRKMTFFVVGTQAKGDLVNYQLLYFPSGTTGPGTVVGTNSASASAPGAAYLVSIDLTSPVAVPSSFTGNFVLRADVQGTRKYSFQPELRTVTVNEGFVVATEDLPLYGDTYMVN